MDNNTYSRRYIQTRRKAVHNKSLSRFVQSNVETSASMFIFCKGKFIFCKGKFIKSPLTFLFCKGKI